MSKKRKNRIIILSLVIFIVAGLIFYTINNMVKKDNEVYILVNNVLQDIYNNYGEKNDKYTDVISNEDYSYLNYRSNDKNIVSEKNEAKITKLEINGNNSIVEYSYVYRAYDKNGNELDGAGTLGEPIVQTITLHKEKGNWCIVEVYEPY